MSKGLRTGLLIGLFVIPFIPVVINTPTLYPLVTGKNFVFRILTELLFAGWLILIITQKKYRPTISSILAALLSFIGVILLANSMGENPYRSFWGDLERMEGLITLIHLLGYFLVATSLLDTEKLWDYFFNTFIIAGSFISVLGLFQLTGIAMITKDAGRIDASFGNSGWLAAYLLLLFFITVFMLSRHHGPMLRWIYGGLLVLQVSLLYATGTRSALIGLIGGICTVALCILVFGRDHKNLRRTAIGVLAAVVLLVGGFFALRDASFVKNTFILNRFNEMIDGGVYQPRFYFWIASLEAFKEKPILGWGQENFNLVYQKYYHPKLYESDSYALRSDRAHNVFLEWLVAGGLLGLLAYLSLFAALIYHLWLRQKSTWTLIEKSILTGLCVAYCINNFFLFDNIATYILFFTMLGYVHVRSLPKVEKLKKQRPPHSSLSYYSAAALLVVSIFAIYFINAKAIRASYEAYQAVKAFPVDIVTSLAYFQRAISRQSYGTDEIQRKLAVLAIEPDVKNQSEAVKNSLYHAASEAIDGQMRKFPSDPYVLYLGGLYYYDIGDYGRAETVLEQARMASPRKQVILLKLADVYIQTRNFKKAYEIAREAYMLESTYTLAHIAYAQSIIYNDIPADSQEFIDALNFLESQSKRISNDSIRRALEEGYREQKQLRNASNVK